MSHLLMKSLELKCHAYIILDYLCYYIPAHRMHIYFLLCIIYIYISIYTVCMYKNTSEYLHHVYLLMFCIYIHIYI